MNRKSFSIISILVFISTFVFCGNTTHENFFSLSFTPGVSIPVSDSSLLFGPGGGADLAGNFRILPFLDLNAVLNYNFIPIKENQEISLNILALGAGGTASYEILDNLDIGINGKIGYFFGYVDDENAPPGGGNPYVSGGIGVSYRIIPSLSLGIDASYRNFFGLYNDVTAMISGTYHFLPPKTGTGGELRFMNQGDDLEISQVQFHIFPVLFKYYDTKPVGKAILKNKGDRTISNIKVSLFTKEYMDNPKMYETGFDLKRNEEKEIMLYALFNRNVLNITEGTKVSCTITCEYTKRDKKLTQEFIETMELYNRNAITWDDDRKAAAFVTSKDPTVLRFSKNVAGLIKGQASKAINNNLSMAIGIHEALSLYGMTYVKDPSTPYEEFSTKEMVIDFLQFPNQTLQYKAGDCDDLSILYCALLESVGIETAFITVPGHIYTAFSLDMDSTRVKRYFQHTTDLLFENNTAWVPVEITSIEGGFLKAWQAGAKMWREHKAGDKAGFFPMHEAWQDFTPVGYNTVEENIELPNQKKFITNYNMELIKFVNYEIYSRVAELKDNIKKTRDNVKYVNKLGTLYAKYGLYKDAEDQFSIVLKKQEYVPALVNMGNIYYLKKNYDEAIKYYERARKKAPDNPVVLLSVARIHHEIENYANAAKAYDELKRIDPELALEFSYLELKGEEAGRAYEMTSPEELVIWEEED